MWISIRPTADGCLIKPYGSVTLDCNGEITNLFDGDTYQIHIKSNIGVIDEAYERGYADGLKKLNGERHHVIVGIEPESEFDNVTAGLPANRFGDTDDIDH